MRLVIFFDMLLNPSFKKSYSQLTKLFLISRNINYPRKSLIYLNQVYTFQSNQTIFENPKSSLLLKRFIFHQIKVHLSYLTNSYFCNYKPSPRILRQHCVLQNLRKNKDIVITKPDKGNGVAILDRKIYNNAIEEIISDKAKWRPNLERWSFTTTLFM